MVKAVLPVQCPDRGVGQVHRLRVEHAIEPGSVHDVGRQHVREARRDRRHARPELDARPRRGPERGTVDVHQQLVVLTEELEQHRLAGEDLFVDEQALGALEVESGGSGCGEQALEHAL